MASRLSLVGYLGVAAAIFAFLERDFVGVSLCLLVAVFAFGVVYTVRTIAGKTEHHELFDTLEAYSRWGKPSSPPKDVAGTNTTK